MVVMSTEPWTLVLITVYIAVGTLFLLFDCYKNWDKDIDET